MFTFSFLYIQITNTTAARCLFTGTYRDCTLNKSIFVQHEEKIHTSGEKILTVYLKENWIYQKIRSPVGSMVSHLAVGSVIRSNQINYTIIKSFILGDLVNNTWQLQQIHVAIWSIITMKFGLQNLAIGSVILALIIEKGVDKILNMCPIQ